MPGHAINFITFADFVPNASFKLFKSFGINLRFDITIHIINLMKFEKRSEKIVSFFFFKKFCAVVKF